MGALAQQIVLKIHGYEQRQELKKDAEEAEKAVADAHKDGKSQEEK